MTIEYMIKRLICPTRPVAVSPGVLKLMDPSPEKGYYLHHGEDYYGDHECY